MAGLLPRPANFGPNVEAISSLLSCE